MHLHQTILNETQKPLIVPVTNKTIYDQLLSRLALNNTWEDSRIDIQYISSEFKNKKIQKYYNNNETEFGFQLS